MSEELAREFEDNARRLETDARVWTRPEIRRAQAQIWRDAAQALRRPCKVRREGDQMRCPECRLLWDIDDANPPECKKW